MGVDGGNELCRIWRKMRKKLQIWLSFSFVELKKKKSSDLRILILKFKSMDAFRIKTKEGQDFG